MIFSKIVLIFIAFMVLISVTAGKYTDQEDQDWINYKNKYRKIYSEVEDAWRKQSYFKAISEFPKITSYTPGTTKFTDWLPQEVKSHFQYKGPQNIVYSTLPKGSHLVAPTPSVLDYRDSSFLSAMRPSAGPCTAGWAYAAASALEFKLKKQQNVIRDLSEAYIINCVNPTATLQGNCFTPISLQSAFTLAANGLPTQAQAPFVFEDFFINNNGTLPSCNISTYNPITPVTPVQFFSQVSQAALIDLLQSGPVAVSLRNQPWITNYGSGTAVCYGAGSFDDQALLVGYDTDPNDPSSPRWIIRYSQGADYGNNGGYVYISRLPGFNCRIGEQVARFSPLVSATLGWGQHYQTMFVLFSVIIMILFN